MQLSKEVFTPTGLLIFTLALFDNKARFRDLLLLLFAHPIG
ncbi:hypothetical protein [Microcoleus sp. LEGE 07076]|nr:hypothetical protein [Microcoleus sp. LEGE 07076]